MASAWRVCCSVVILIFVFDGAWSRFEGGHRRSHRNRNRQIVSYPRDWDTDWSEQPQTRRRAGRGSRRDWEAGDPVPEYSYQADPPPPVPQLHPRMVVLSNPKIETRGVIHSQQRGSAIIPYPGATVRVPPQKGSSKKFYRGAITSIISDGAPPRRRNRSHRHKNRGSPRHEHWEYSQDEPAHPKVCARCPSDRAVLAKKGSVFVLMETPPIIPCHPWSSVEKVKQEVVAGPQPGEEVLEGSHKIVIRLYHHRKTLVNCVTRYNVIVRKCPELEVGPGVTTDCPLGKAWGAHCNVTCDLGYDLEGDSDTECTDDLEWSGVMPQCIPTTSCPVPVSPDNGHLSCRTPQHQPVRPKGMLPDGTVCHYLCHAGYMVPPAQQHLTRVRCIAGSWDSDQDPICIETNELEEEEPHPEVSAVDALRFDGKDCPDNFCQNGGKCIMILNDPMCSCRSGYSGPQCEDQHIDPDPDESNTIT